jgi:hypothetical protein
MYHVGGIKDGENKMVYVHHPFLDIDSVDSTGIRLVQS